MPRKAGEAGRRHVPRRAGIPRAKGKPSVLVNLEREPVKFADEAHKATGPLLDIILNRKDKPRASPATDFARRRPPAGLPSPPKGRALVPLAQIRSGIKQAGWGRWLAFFLFIAPKEMRRERQQAGSIRRTKLQAESSSAAAAPAVRQAAARKAATAPRRGAAGPLC